PLRFFDVSAGRWRLMTLDVLGSDSQCREVALGSNRRREGRKESAAGGRTARLSAGGRRVERRAASGEGRAGSLRRDEQNETPRVVPLGEAPETTTAGFAQSQRASDVCRVPDARHSMTRILAT